MLQGYFLIRDHFYICDKFAHGPTEKDEVYLRGYVSWLVHDETAVTFLEKWLCSQEAGRMLGHTLSLRVLSPSTSGSSTWDLTFWCWDPGSHSMQLIKEQVPPHGIWHSDAGILAVIACSWSKNRSLTSWLRSRWSRCCCWVSWNPWEVCHCSSRQGI